MNPARPDVDCRLREDRASVFIFPLVMYLLLIHVIQDPLANLPSVCWDLQYLAEVEPGIVECGFPFDCVNSCIHDVQALLFLVGHGPAS